VKETQVLIVGGGPAGLACARALYLRGHRPVVLEKRHWPVDKVCGEGILPVGRQSLARLGVDPPGQPFTGIEYVRGRERAAADFLEGPGLAVRRLELSRALLHPEMESLEGCRLQHARRQGDWMEVETTQGSWRCRLLVAADGLHSPLRHLFQLHRSTPSWLRRWGWRQHFQVSPWNHRVEVHYAPGCEAYLSPVGPDSLGVAVLSGPGRNRSNWLEPFGELRERLGQRQLSPLAGLGPLWQRAGSVHIPGLVLVGDAAGYLDACTGEGLSLALAQAEALAKLLPAHSSGLVYMPEYATTFASIVRHYHALTWGVLLINRFPRLALAALRTLRRNPRIFQQLLSANQGLRSPYPALAQLALRLPFDGLRALTD